MLASRYLIAIYLHNTINDYNKRPITNMLILLVVFRQIYDNQTLEESEKYHVSFFFLGEHFCHSAMIVDMK